LYRLHPSFDIDCDTQTSPDIGAAMAELVNHSTPLPNNKTAVVALTCARNTDLAEQIAHVWHAGDEGIRMHLGILPKKDQVPFGPRPREQTVLTGKIREEDLITAVLRTGGTYSILHNRDAIPRFVDHVISRGLTEYDNARDTATLLPVGLSISDHVEPESEPRRFSFDASYTDNVVIAVAPMTPKLALHVTVRHVRKNIVLSEQYIGLRGNSTFRAKLDIDDVPRTDAWFELEVAHAEGDGLVGSGLFEVSIETESTGANAESNGEHRSGKDQHDEL
jgi:hypothetical protein